MKINFSDIKNELLRHCIIHLISQDKEKGDTVVDKTHKNDGQVDLDFSINGVEFSILKWFNRLDKEIDQQIQEKAEELVRDKINEVESEFYDILEEARERILKKNEDDS